MKTFSPEEWENVPSNTANSNTSNTPSAYSNTSEDTRAKVERVLSLIEQKGIDILKSATIIQYTIKGRFMNR